MQRGDCRTSRTAPLNAVDILYYIYIISLDGKSFSLEISSVWA